MAKTPYEKWLIRTKVRLSSLTKEGGSPKIRKALFVFLIVSMLLVTGYVFYQNYKVTSTKEYNRATVLIDEVSNSASSINTKDLLINKPEIPSEETESRDFIPLEEVTQTQTNKPPVERTVQFGITKDKNENTIVGLYDIEKHNDKYRRYFVYTCSKNNTVIKFDNGQYFGFGLTNDGKRMPIKMISLGLNLYRADDDKTIKDILILLNQSNKMSLILNNDQVFVLSIKPKQSTTLPCL